MVTPEAGTTEPSQTRPLVNPDAQIHPVGHSAYRHPLMADDYRVEGEMKILYIILAILTIPALLVAPVTIGLLAFAVAYAFYKLNKQLGRSVKISEHQFPSIQAIVQAAAKNLDMPAPKVFIQQEPELGAYSTGLLGNRCVVLHSSLVEAMTDEELTFVVGHELSHIKCRHTTFTMLTGSAGELGIPYLSQVFGFLFLFWSRKAEFTADRGGLLACRNARASASALAKLAVGKNLFEKLDIEQFLAQREERNANDFGQYTEILADHPALVDRIHLLRQFHESDLYKKIVPIEAAP
jgi:Zn-dependent protease with chaperone function